MQSIVLILNFLFGKNKDKTESKPTESNSNIYPKSVVVKVNRLSNEEIDIGEKLKLWNKPNTNYCYLYLRGSVNGEGLLGKFKNQKLANEIVDYENKHIKCEIVSFTNARVEVKILVERKNKTK